MRRLAALLSLTLAGAALGGCHKTGSNAGQDLKHPGQSAPVNTVQDVTAGPVGLASAATVGGATTAGYVNGQGIADMYEIQAAKIALQRSKNPGVKQMAQMIIADHTKLSDKLKATVKSANISTPVPTALDNRRQGMIDNLKAAGDTDFDGAYLHQQLAAHLEALTLVKSFQNHGDNDALKGLAASAAPVIQKHIDMIRKVGGAELKNVASPST